MNTISNQVIEGERVVLTDGELYMLGPALELRRCTVVLDLAASDLTVTDVTFSDCEIEAPRPFGPFWWYEATITDCRFSGRFDGCDFGRFLEAFDVPGTIERCDFADAVLDGCRIVESDPSTLQFPPWPCFTILDPVARADELLAIQWPGDIGSMIEGVVDFPQATTAVTFSANSLVDELGGTPAELRAVVEEIPEVLR